MKKQNRRKLPVVMGGLLLSAMALAGVAAIANPVAVANAINISYNGKFKADYASLDEAKAAADDLNVELAAEGDVLLKNDGTLPFFGNEKVSVFGGAQDGMVGATGSQSIAAALAEEGFRVNPTLKAYYDAERNTIGTEKSDFDASITQSYRLYNEAAVVVLSRTGGEGADLNTVMTEVEDNKDGDGVDYDWEHAALHEDDAGAHKHYLQLTNSEEALIAHVKANFKKIVVVVNTSNAMEMANLQNDPAISGIIWIGRPGSTGVKALAQILNGKVNPSGKLVDEWARDFTLDPTWQNFGVNKQVGTTNLYDYNYNDIAGAPKPGSGNGFVGGDGYYGIDYDEGIYLGYRYYETVYAELLKDSTIRYNASTHKIVKKATLTDETYNAASAANAWWEQAVVYPFGYGLSYTTFSQNIQDIYYKDGTGKHSLGSDVSAALFNSSKGSVAQVEKIYVPVKVTNTGSVAGKQVVQIYVTPPYTPGGIEKSENLLVGFAKTSKLKPGQSEVVTVEVNVQDMASFDYKDSNNNSFKGYELEEGAYKLKAMNDSHRVADEVSFNLTGTAKLGIDDFSHNEVKTVFSNGDTFDTVRKNSAKGDDDLFLDVTKTDEGEQKLLSRGDFSVVDAQGLVITDAERSLSDEFVKNVMYWTAYTTDNQAVYNDDGCSYFYDALAPENHYSWYKTEEELTALTAGWSQHASHESDFSDAPIKLKDMSGVALTDAKWTEFMNQLTWSDMQTLINSAMRSTKAINAIDKPATSDPNGPNDFGGKYWCDETVVSSTWNTELAEHYGIINGNIAMFSNYGGWYGPGINTHRSPFGGRNNEYFSQDGYQGGAMAAAVVGGAQSRGINVWAKHMFMNDQEENRSRQCLFTWADEQAIREIYAKQFQMALQEGECSASMVAYNRIGGVVSCANYAFQQRLVRDEWGWEGEYVTDYYGNNAIQTNSMDLMVRCGGNLPDGTASGAKAMRGTYNAERNTVVIGSGDNTVDSKTEWYYGRMAAMRSLYVAANTLNVKNGVSTTEFAKAATIEATQGVAVNSALGLSVLDANGGSARYELASGTLPEGLSLNTSTGALTGTTKALPGQYKVTIKAVVDGYITANKSVTINVASAFTLSESTAAAGEEFFASIDSEVVTSAKYTKGITYSIEEGNLPAGLTLDQDSIVGTPTEVGKFDVTLKVAAAYTSGRNTVTDTFLTKFTLTVTGEAPVVPEEPETKEIVSVEENATGDGYVITFSDGTTIEIKNGKDGADGKDGVNGQDGKDGKDGVDGAPGKDGKDGVNGQDGAPGRDGVDGKDGKDGADGKGCAGSIAASSAVIAVLGTLGLTIAAKKKED